MPREGSEAFVDSYGVKSRHRTRCLMDDRNCDGDMTKSASIKCLTGKVFASFGGKKANLYVADGAVDVGGAYNLQS